MQERGEGHSEVWFGWATQEELQPNIDGLSFDEVLRLGLVPGIATVLATRRVTRTTPQPVTPAQDGAGGQGRGGDHQHRLLGELQHLRSLAAT